MHTHNSNLHFPTQMIVKSENLITFIGSPTASDLPQLRVLWKEAFGDTDEFLDLFYHTAYSLTRCHCIKIDEQIVAALYWFDCSFLSQPVAYIYAVATASSCRGQGLCHTLMTYTHQQLRTMGYIGTVLVPGSKELFNFYQDMGYQISTYIDELHLKIRANTVELTAAAYETNDFSTATHATTDFLDTSYWNKVRTLSAEEYAHLRHSFLPEYSILQEQENLSFLATQAKFLAGEDFLLVYQKQDDFLLGIELLGNTSIAEDLLLYFDCSKGSFRTPGSSKPFAMYYALSDNGQYPSYFGFAFD